MRQISIAATFITCLLWWNSAATIRAQTPVDTDDEVVRVDVDLTNLLFTASDKHGRLITTLQETDIRVLEDGTPQKILIFQRETNRPLSLAFLVDISASEEGTLPQEKAAARKFIETVIRSSQDEAAIIPFTHRAFLEQGLTGNLIELYLALARLEAAVPSYTGSGQPIGGLVFGPGMQVPSEGSSAIWDAISVTASEILGLRPGNKRRAIILLSDGVDFKSQLSREAAIQQALSGETIIYAIGIGDKLYEGVNEGALRAVAQGTGGRAFFPKTEADLAIAFAQIEQELRAQYLAAYSPTNKTRDGSYRKLRIEIATKEMRKELKLRYRPGYYVKPLKRRGSGG